MVVAEPYLVSNGVKHGCVLAPKLFSLLYYQMLSTAISQTDAGVQSKSVVALVVVSSNPPP